MAPSSLKGLELFTKGGFFMHREHQTFGRHILLDVWGVDYDKLNDLGLMRQTMLRAAEACGATVVKTAFQRFPVQGLSGVVVLAESHISVHTHPEHRYASFDIFTCGTTIDPGVACRYIVDTLRVQRYNAREFVRGEEDGIKDVRSEGRGAALPELALAAAR